MIIERPVCQLVSRVGSGCYTVNLMEKSNLKVEKFQQFAEINSLSKKDISYDEIERKFWRALGLNGGLDDPMYGADMVGSLFGTDTASSWNVNNLDTPLKIIGKSLPGVSNSMLYFGCWRAMFAFHTEDMELYSINYLHYGSPKSWYSIPPKYKKRFEVMAQSYYPEEYNDCHEFLRHKTSLISHTRLKDCAIPYHTAVQEVGEFMITFPGSYHQGFNHGFNIAEATNFATERWIDIAREANICRCEPDSVKIDMDIFETLYYREKMMKKLKSTQNNINNDTNNDIIDLTDESDNSNLTSSPLINNTEIFNTNDLNESKWLLRCKCGKRTWYPMISTPSNSNLQAKEEIQTLNYVSLLVAEGEIFQCIECGLWSHIECVYGPSYNESNLPDDAKCHMCLNLNIEENDEDINTSIDGCNIYVSCSPLDSDPESESESDDKHESEYQYQSHSNDNSIPNNKDKNIKNTSNSNNKTKNENRNLKSKKYKPHLHDIITTSVYSKTSLKYENITGEIVAIEGTNIRIHVKVFLSLYYFTIYLFTSMFVKIFKTIFIG